MSKVLFLKKKKYFRDCLAKGLWKQLLISDPDPWLGQRIKVSREIISTSYSIAFNYHSPTTHTDLNIGTHSPSQAAICKIMITERGEILGRASLPPKISQ